MVQHPFLDRDIPAQRRSASLALRLAGMVNDPDLAERLVQLAAQFDVEPAPPKETPSPAPSR